RRSVAKAAGGHGQQLPQSRDPELLQRRRRNVADGPEAVSGGNRQSGRRSRQSLYSGTAGAGLLSDQSIGQAARNRSQTAWNQCAYHGAGTRGSGGPHETADHLTTISA